MSQSPENDGKKLAQLICDAGGKIVGRTRLQKIVYIFTLAGLMDGFHFDYHYYGPYSEEVTRAASTAQALGLVKESFQETAWGASYSVYTCEISANGPTSERKQLAAKAASANSIALELAATAAYFADNGSSAPWEETAQHKPDKAGGGRIEEAKVLYEALRAIAPALPEIA